MAREILTDEEVEQEIERIKNTEAFKLGSAYIAYKNRRREYLYNLRNKERVGLELMKRGITLDNFTDEFSEEC